MNKKTSQTSIILKNMRKNRGAMIGLAVILLLIVIAILAPYISPYKYDAADFSSVYEGPSWKHPFGTDDLGRDILSRLMYGARYSLGLGISATIVGFLMGMVIGSMAGFFGGKVDLILMRLLDIFSAIPMILLCIVVSAALGTGIPNTVLALSFGGMAGFARMARASILSIRSMEYLEAATSINCGTLRILIKHVIPNAISPMIVQATMGVANVILAAAMLSFIGLGVQPPLPEWGAMLSAGRNYIRQYPHLVIFPGLCIMMTVLSLNMLGDGLRDAIDPKLKK